MLLGSSSQAIDTPADAAAVMNDDDDVDPGVEAGAELLAFTTAAHRLDDSLVGARTALEAAVGRAGMIDAAVTAAIFRGLNIAADASGIRVDDAWEPIARQLADDIGTGTFRTIQNSPAVSAAMPPPSV